MADLIRCRGALVAVAAVLLLSAHAGCASGPSVDELLRRSELSLACRAARTPDERVRVWSGILKELDLRVTARMLSDKEVRALFGKRAWPDVRRYRFVLVTRTSRISKRSWAAYEKDTLDLWGFKLRYGGEAFVFRRQGPKAILAMTPKISTGRSWSMGGLLLDGITRLLTFGRLDFSLRHRLAPKSRAKLLSGGAYWSRLATIFHHSVGKERCVTKGSRRTCRVLLVLATQDNYIGSWPNYDGRVDAIVFRRWGKQPCDHYANQVIPLAGGATVRERLAKTFAKGPVPLWKHARESWNWHPGRARQLRFDRRMAARRTKRLNALLAALRAEIGKPVTSAALKHALRLAGVAPEIRRFDDSFYYSYKSLGLSLRFVKPTSTLAAIFLYRGLADGFWEFGGTLPAGLRWSSTRAEVEKKLGRPSKEGGGRYLRYYSRYASLGLGFNYTSKSTTDLSNRIRVIVLSRALPKSSQPKPRPRPRP